MSFSQPQPKAPLTPTLASSSSLFGSSLATHESTQHSIIVPNGLLCELNYALSMVAFAGLAATPINFKDPQLMGKILAADNLLKNGGSVSDFRTTLRQIFNLRQDVTDEQIDLAWSAMLGKLEVLHANYASLKTQNKDKNILLMSGTSEIHMEAILKSQESQEEKTDIHQTQQPILLSGLKCYVSYLLPKLTTVSEADRTLLADLAKDENNNIDEKVLLELAESLGYLKAIKAKEQFIKTPILVLEDAPLLGQSELKPVEKRNARIAEAKKRWAETEGFLIAHFNRQSITQAITAVDVITQAVNIALYSKLTQEISSLQI